MQLVPCAVGPHRSPEKPSTLFWAWNRADGVRKAYKQRLCVGHFAERIVPLEVAAEGELLVCPCCGISTQEDLDPVYLIAYLPGVGREDCQLATCGACAAKLRAQAMENAVELENRSLGAESQPPTKDSSAVWRALGRNPDA